MDDKHGARAADPLVRALRRAQRFAAQWSCGVTAALVLLPGLAAMVTGSLYIARGGGPGDGRAWQGFLNSDAAHTVLYGSLIALALCGLLGVVLRRVATPRGGQPSVYGNLCQKLDGLSGRLEVACREPLEPRRRAACEEARRHRSFVEGELYGDPEPVGQRWLLATGYIDVWKRLHRIEECLLELEPRSTVLREALHDKLRAGGSTIAESKILVEKLDGSIAALGGSEGEPSATKPRTQPEQEARATLREVRSAISEFRDSRRDGLVRARNNLYATLVFTGLTAYTLLAIAVLSGASRKAVVAAAVFYLAGAVAGLFRRLGVAFAESASQEDFGLSLARLLNRPLFSGLAAIGGVVLAGLLPPIIPNTGGAAEAGIRPLVEVFDLAKNTEGLIWAVVFGFAPTLLTRGLERQAERYKRDLEKSQAAETSPAGGQP